MERFYPWFAHRKIKLKEQRLEYPFAKETSNRQVRSHCHVCKLEPISPSRRDYVACIKGCGKIFDSSCMWIKSPEQLWAGVVVGPAEPSEWETEKQ